MEIMTTRPTIITINTNNLKATRSKYDHLGYMEIGCKYIAGSYEVTFYKIYDGLDLQMLVDAKLISKKQIKEIKKSFK